MPACILKRPLLWYAASALLLLAACSAFKEDTAAKVARVQAGMARADVLALLGPPQRREEYGGTEFLIYSTDGTSSTALLEFTPIAVVDGRVTGTGRPLYEAVVQAHTRQPRPDATR